MGIEKIDKNARDLLAYLNTNVDLSSATLAEIFNQHFKNDLESSLATLSFLENKGYIKTKTDAETNNVIMIQVTHLGRTYEQTLKEQEKEYRRRVWSERAWNIITLILSAIISILINLFMEV